MDDDNWTSDGDEWEHNRPTQTQSPSLDGDEEEEEDPPMVTTESCWSGEDPLLLADEDEQEDCCTCALPSTSHAADAAEPLFGRTVVKLRKGPGRQLGLGIAGGSDRPIPPTVSYLRPGFVAHRCDQLQVGDLLVCVNGVRTSTLTHAQVLALLRNAGSEWVELELEYALQECTAAASQRRGIRRELVELELREECAPEAEDHRGMFGLTLRGGAYGPDAQKARPLTVAAIRTGGAAHREGRLRVGDRVLAINGVPTGDCTLPAALNLIRAARPLGRLALCVDYDVCVLPSLRSMPGPLLLEIEKVAGVDFGTELAIRHVPVAGPGKQCASRRAVLVSRIVPASVADRCGAVRCGDEVLAIDGISLELIGGLAEAYQLLRSESALLRLELVPSAGGDMARTRCRTENNDPLRRMNQSMVQLDSPQQQQQQQDSVSLRRRSLRSGSATPAEEGRSRPGRGEQWAPNGKAHHSQSPLGRHQQQRQRRPTGRAAIGSVSARLSASPQGAVCCHQESMELVLEEASAWPSFGIVLARGGAANGAAEEEEAEDALDGTTPLVVAQIERGSPADRCGVLQPGDRVLCINEWQTAEGTLQEAQHLLRACSLSSTARCVTLLVEFSVIEPVLPPGPGSLFVVRLAKRGASLGIVCRSEHKGAAKGEPLIIADVRMGSVAHRCGAIQVGDRIHSIDNIPLDTCTVEESIRLLQRSGQVVKLCIAKGGDEEQELLDGGGPSQQQMVVYTVELSRKGQPLGITIASAGGLLDPIVISHLAPGGLAERTGALHVGDRILGINGDPLEGKKVAQVTALLQQCADPVAIKVCRLLVPPPVENGGAHQWHSGANKLGTPLKSVDSVVDSLLDETQHSSPPEPPHLRHGSARLAHLRASTSNNFQQADLISGSGGSEPCSGGGWDSGLSSAAATDSQPHQPGCRQQHERCCGCGLASGDSTTQPSSSSASSNSPQSSASGANSSTPGGGKWRTEQQHKEDWVRILEALETVGEEEMLRKLEECILSGQASNYMPNGAKSHQQLLPMSSESGVLSRRFLSSADNYASAVPPNYAKPPPPCSLLKRPPADNSRDATPLCGERNSQPGTPVLPVRRLTQNSGSFELPPPMPSPRTSTAPVSCSLLPLSANTPSSSSTFASPSSEAEASSAAIPFITSPPPPIGLQQQKAEEDEDQFDELSEVFSVQLARCPLMKSFGFSVCDGGSGAAEPRDHHQKQGIYVRSVIKDGPADKNGRIQPGDRILQINGRSIQFLSCDLALPLLATERVDLLLLRNRTPQPQSRRPPNKF